MQIYENNSRGCSFRGRILATAPLFVKRESFRAGWDIEWSRKKSEVDPDSDLRQEFLIIDSQWLDAEGGILDHIKDLPDDTELVSIIFRWA